MVLESYKRFTFIEESEVVKERQTSLNIAEMEEYRLLMLIMFIKSAFSGYIIKKVVLVDAVLLCASFLHSWNFGTEDLVMNVIFYASASVLMLLFYDQFAFSGAAWTISIMSMHFHYTLDFYVVLTILSSIAHKCSKQPCLTVACLICIDWICYNLIAQVQSAQPVVMLYDIPVLLIKTFGPFDNGRVRALCRTVWGSLWLYYHFGKTEYVRSISRDVFAVLKSKANYYLALLDCIKQDTNFYKKLTM